jgi:YegS/Rv2252/BmrU family lipid kinase
MKIKIIGNPVAGQNGLEKIRHTAQIMAEMGVQVEVVLTEYAGHAEVLAENCRGVDRLVVAGGDGTMNEVINGMMPDPVPLAVVPLGTANVLALETGLPTDLQGQCENAVRGEVRWVTLGQAGERYFLLMAGAGLDAEVVRRLNVNIKRWLGKAAYLLSGLRVLCRLPAPVDLKSDKCHRTGLAGVIVCNSRMYGGSFTLASQASLFSPTLQVVTLPRSSALGLLGLIMGSLLRRGLATEIKIFESSEVVIAGEAALQLDGDSAGMLPCKITAHPAALPLVLRAVKN